MDFIREIFFEPSVVQAVIVLSLVCAAGLYLGKIKFFGISLGVTFVFFIGILAGHFGLKINGDMLDFAQNFGLIIFVYTLGLQVGPGFFSSLKKGGVKLNIMSLTLIAIGLIFILTLSWTTNISLSDLMGLLSGAVTNTPMLGAAQQAILQINPDDDLDVTRMALACAVAYPLGVIGVILAIIILKKMFAKDSEKKSWNADDKTYVGEYHVSNPAVFGKTIKDIMLPLDMHFVISRVWHNGKVSIPASDTLIQKNDHLLIISGKSEVDSIKTIFGEQEGTDWNRPDIDWNAIDSLLVSRHVLVTNSKMDGVKLGSLRLRNAYGINITRVNRAGINLVASPALRLQTGDRLTIVGESKAIDNCSKILGNEARELNNPNLIAIFIGLVLGLLLGSVPVLIPGMGMPIKLGLAGGPIIVGILMGAFGPRFHLTTYTTQSANLMIRQFGITTYLAGLGLASGEHFFETVFCKEGLLWILLGLTLAVVPVMIVGIIAGKFFKVDYARNVGMLCGSMANPMALNYANTTVKGDEPSVAYATVYPLAIFVRVITAQLVLLVFS